MDPTWVVEIVHEPDHNHIPVQNVERIMRRVLDQVIKIERDAKALVQECVSEFIGLVTDDAKVFMERGARKTVTGPDVVLALEDLWFKPYADLVRTLYWPETLGDGPASCKKRNRPPPPLESAQQQYIESQEIKRWRGERPTDSGNSHSDETKALSKWFVRVLTIDDLNVSTHCPANDQVHQPRSTVSRSSSSLQNFQTGLQLSWQMPSIEPIDRPDEDDSSEFSIPNLTIATTPVNDLSLIADRVAEACDGIAPMTLLPQDDRMAAVVQNPRTCQQLRTVLSSPHLTTFPTSEELRSRCYPVRSMDPFSSSHL